MNEIVSVPLSVRHQLERARNLIDNGRSGEAENVLKEAGMALARTNPELAALLVATQLGYREITATVTETSSQTTHTDKRFLGWCYANEYNTITNSRTTTRRMQLS